MDNRLKTSLMDVMANFALPRYEQLPDVGLYLEQTAKYINQCLQPLGFAEMTGSMIRNYVKMGLVANPVQKHYFAEHIAHLIAIFVLKHVVPLEHIHKMFDIQRKVYTDRTAYNYFCMELENFLYYRFGLKDDLEEIGVTESLEKEILRSAIVAVSHMVYLNACFQLLPEKDT